MINVDFAINLNTNWFPDFSYPVIPKNYQGKIPKRWELLTEKVPEGKGMPQVKNMVIKNLTSSYEENYTGRSTAFFIQAFDLMDRAKFFCTYFNILHLDILDGVFVKCLDKEGCGNNNKKLTLS